MGLKAVMNTGKADMQTAQIAHPPETIEGWYALHQIFRLDRIRLDEVRNSIKDFSQVFANMQPKDGWSACVRLTGSRADIMFIHFRRSLDELDIAQRTISNNHIVAHTMTQEYSFLSVTEAGLYHITAQLAKQYEVGSDEYRSALDQKIKAELEGQHVQRRLYPQLPDDMPYVCFYPMNKQRGEKENWYTLTLEERSRLMQAHGQTGRKYAGKVQQVITGAIGLDAWEWGVTLFAKDPLDFKKLVTDMRFDEVSARYAEFGEFWVGRVVPAGELFS